MSSIKFSSDYLAGSSNITDQTGSLMARMLGMGGQGLAYDVTSGERQSFMAAGDTNNIPAQYSNLGILRLMSGPRPTISSLGTSSNAPAGTTILWQARALGAMNSANNNFSQSGTLWYQNPAQLSTVLVAAVATGTTTWFWLLTALSSNSGALNGTAVHHMTGTVGVVGSGADMTLISTSISSGQFIRLLNLRFQFPLSMS